MAWAEMLEPSFRGVVFDVVTIRDGKQRAHAEHSVPYREGADVEDLGGTARSMQVTAVFFGDDYKERLDAFIAALDEPGAGELVHPIFGSVPRAQVSDYDIEHDADAVDAATVHVNFKESSADIVLLEEADATQDAAAIETSADEALELSTDALTEQLGKLTGTFSIPGFGDLTLPEIKLPYIDVAALAGNLDISRLADVRSLMDGVPDLLSGTLQGLPDLNGLIDNTLSGIPLANFDSVLNPRAWAGDLTALTGGILDANLDIGAMLPFDINAIRLPELSALGIPSFSGLPGFNLPDLPSFELPGIGDVLTDLPALNVPSSFGGMRAIARQVSSVGSGLTGVARSITRAQSDARSLFGLPDAAANVMRGFRAVAAVFSPPVRVAAVPTAKPTVTMSRSAPLTFTPTVRQPRRDALVVATHVQTSFATTLAVAARRVLEVEAKMPLFTPAEIEQVANTTRATIQTAIQTWRANHDVEARRPVIAALENTALLVQAIAQRLIVRRPPIVTRRLTTPANTRLLAHRLYGDHTRAHELVRLNNYGRSPILEAGDKVSAYAR